MDKYAIEELAADIADDMGYDYFDLSPKMRAKIYKIALDEHSDMLADKADMMRKNEASGGLMRAGYALGSEDEIPEQEDMSPEEFEDIKKMIGAPTDQASGIKSLKNEMASMDANEKEFERLVDEFMENGFSLQEAIDEAKRVLEEKSVRRKAPSIKMAELDTAIDEYKQYVYDMEEAGKIPMTFEQYMQQVLAEARMGVMGGGILRANFNAGSAEIYEPERRERQAEIREEKATDIPSRRKAKDLDINIEKVKALIEAAKKDKIKRTKGGVASILGD